MVELQQTHKFLDRYISYKTKKKSATCTMRVGLQQTHQFFDIFRYEIRRQGKNSAACTNSYNLDKIEVEIEIYED